MQPFQGCVIGGVVFSEQMTPLRGSRFLVGCFSKLIQLFQGGD